MRTFMEASQKTDRRIGVPLPINGLRLLQDLSGTHSENRRLGYARVSTYGQTLDAQLKRPVGRPSREVRRYYSSFGY